jgi:hypothetical protein
MARTVRPLHPVDQRLELARASRAVGCQVCHCPRSAFGRSLPGQPMYLSHNGAAHRRGPPAEHSVFGDAADDLGEAVFRRRSSAVADRPAWPSRRSRVVDQRHVPAQDRSITIRPPTQLTPQLAGSAHRYAAMGGAHAGEFGLATYALAVPGEDEGACPQERFGTLG